MENLPFILITVMAALVYAAYFYTERRLCEEQAITAILREREVMAERLLVSYCRRLLTDADRSYVNIDEAIIQMNHVLQIYGYEPPKPSDSCLLTPDSSTEGGV